jgi:hypothetical protein
MGTCGSVLSLMCLSTFDLATVFCLAKISDHLNPVMFLSVFFRSPRSEVPTERDHHQDERQQEEDPRAGAQLARDTGSALVQTLATITPNGDTPMGYL